MLGAFLLLPCNRIFVVCFFGVRAHEADRRAELALRGVRWERGRLVCDSYSASLWLFCESSLLRIIFFFFHLLTSIDEKRRKKL